jgi:hypothetical protein
LAPNSRDVSSFREFLEESMSLALASHFDRVFGTDQLHIVASGKAMGILALVREILERRRGKGHKRTAAFRPVRGDAKRPLTDQPLGGVTRVQPRHLHLGS